MRNTFGKDIIPPNEAARLAALHRYEILDTPPEGAFNKIATLAQSIFKVPIALVSLVDRERVFFKANAGMGTMRSTDRGVSLCSLAILQEGATVFEDAPEDPCLLHNPLVAGDFGLRFYAGAPITTYDGYRIGTVCIVDHTPRSFSDEQRAMLEQLASLVMDELELRMSARNALAAKNEMLSLTFHDLKNPLNNISGLASLIGMEAGVSENVRKYVGLIQQSAGTLNQVVQGLVDTSLGSHNSSNLKLQATDITALLLQVLNENEATLQKKEQQLSTEVDGPVWLQCDPLRVKLVMDNLISNASKYSGTGSPIMVSLKQLQDKVRLVVTDQGQGLNEQDQELLFGKYSRLSATPTASESSTGLGLYITKRIVEQHNGNIWAESRGKDKGSSFIVELPC